MQRVIAAEQRGMSEAPGPHQHRDQEGHESGRRINVVGRSPLDRRGPPKGVTARLVLRRITGPPDRRAAISGGTTSATLDAALRRAAIIEHVALLSAAALTTRSRTPRKNFGIHAGY
jgi:hypothetical protein